MIFVHPANPYAWGLPTEFSAADEYLEAAAPTPLSFGDMCALFESDAEFFLDFAHHAKANGIKSTQRIMVVLQGMMLNARPLAEHVILKGTALSQCQVDAMPIMAVVRKASEIMSVTVAAWEPDELRRQVALLLSVYGTRSQRNRAA